VRHARGVEEVTVVAPASSKKSQILVGAGAAVAIAAIVVGSFALRVKLPSASLAAINLEPREKITIPQQLIEHEIAPAVVEVDLRERFPVPVVHDTPLDELYPSLLDWIHPVVDTDTVLPEQMTGRFGAERRGVTRTECGSGHCGIDLLGPIGRPIVAVGDGTVVRIERSELGRDGRSGRYVRIEHEDGTLTSYMHLDSIAPGLEVGDHVDGGQQIGTLGATAVYSAAPHCHFALEIPNVPGEHGDNANTHYVDPAPFLVRASIAHAPDRRHALKPAF
jgi:murein DD-endopeptidase MepM/ murein hydrolase activator NlpD